jgi:hypothetical protein
MNNILIVPESEEIKIYTLWLEICESRKAQGERSSGKKRNA